jgi:NTE family protein
MAKKSEKQRVDLVLEGGGVKGVALAGSLSVLEEEGYQPSNVAGASAGAIISSLIAAGYSAAEVGEIIANQDFNLFMDKGLEDRLPKVIGVPLSVLKDQGIFEGNYFLSRIKELLAAKGIYTFKDLIIPEFADQPRYKYKVQVIASDITEKRMLVLPRDAGLLGIEPDDLGVAEAVRMSMSFPIFFEPYRIKDSTGKEHVVVDGGLLSNFPVWLFDSEEKPSWPTFGLRLVEEDNKTSLGDRLPAFDFFSEAFDPIITYLMNIVSTALEAHDRMYIESDNFARTIPIPTLGVSTLDFKLPREKTDALFQSGRDAAQKFLKTWDFERYTTTFRSGVEVSRRQAIVKQMGRRRGRPTKAQ